MYQSRTEGPVHIKVQRSLEFPLQLEVNDSKYTFYISKESQTLYDKWFLSDPDNNNCGRIDAII